MGLIVVIAILGVIYVIYGLIVDNVEKGGREQSKSDQERLREYLAKKNLFDIYKNYFYDKIDYYETFTDYNEVYSKIEQDFPYHGCGITGRGIREDFLIYELMNYQPSQRWRDGKFNLGPTFYIISIAYPNFMKFTSELYNSGTKLWWTEGGGFNPVDDKLKSRVFYIELLERKARYYFGLSGGVLNAEFRLSDSSRYDYNSTYTVKHSAQKKMRKDISVQEYHDFFEINKNSGIIRSTQLDLDSPEVKKLLGSI